MQLKITPALLGGLLFPIWVHAIVPPFWSDNFAFGLAPDWQSFDASGQNVTWEYCSDYRECAPTTYTFIACNVERFESPTVDNGYVFLNSFAAGNLPMSHVSYLQSPSINCSGKSSVFLKFYTYLSGLNLDPKENAVLQVKAGTVGWQDYLVFPDLDENVIERKESWNPRSVLLDISGQAAQQPEVFIRWKWTGNSELVWAIDDVELFDFDPLQENVVWGNLSGQGDFDGSLNGWTVTNIQDTCKWVWDSLGLVYFPDSNPKADFWGCSPSHENGVALMNPTFCVNGGGPSPATRSSLFSPALDLSALPPGTPLAVRFYQSVMIGNAESVQLPVTSVMVSIDGGVSFLDTIDANPVLPFSRPFCGETTIGLPLEVAGHNDVKIVFTFSGTTFFWMVDDVRVVERWSNDLRINSGFSAVSPNAVTPASQLRDLGFLAEVENFGSQFQDFTNLFITVEDEAQSVVFADTLFLGSMAPEQKIDDTVFQKKFLPPLTPGAYTCRYRVAAGLGDEAPSDNRFDWKFEVSENTFAKDNGICTIDGFFAPSENIKYEIGNCYFIQNGADYCASSMGFAFRNAPLMQGTELQVNLYKWKTATTYGDENVDTLANENEYENVAFGSYPVTGAENGEMVVVQLDVDTPCVSLEDSTWYFVTVNYDDPVIFMGQEVPFFIGASEHVDYTAMFWLSYQLGLPQYVSMLRLGDDKDFRANGWALRRIPVIRLYLDKVTADTEEMAKTQPLKVFPNPASQTVFVQWDENYQSPGIWVEIVDICGQLVASRHLSNANVSQLPIDISDLSNGSYILRVISADSLRTGKFVVINH
jgi:type IX secretion system substrate protein